MMVEVSADDGETWERGAIVAGGEGASKWAWTLWKAVVRLKRGRDRKLLSRATDRGGNIQRGDPAWNLRGVAYDGYGEVRDLDVR